MVYIQISFISSHSKGSTGLGPGIVEEKIAPFLTLLPVEKGKDGYYLDYDRVKSIPRDFSHYYLC